MGESHGITIKTKGQGKKWKKEGKKEIRTRGKYWQDQAKGEKIEKDKKKREGGGNKRRKEKTHNAKSKEKGEKNKRGWGGANN